MSDYYSVDFSIQPYSNDAADLLAAFLADEGFESFEDSEGGLRAYVASSQYSSEAIERAIKGMPIKADITYVTEFIKQTDWNAEWEKKYFQPLLLGGGKCVVRSSFHTSYPNAEYEIIVDPKMAFGTGHHATTSMMVDHLFNLDLKGKKIVDMGTGTGILAIISKKLGAESVTGIEIDPTAYENAKENARINNVEVELKCGDVGQLTGNGETDVFLANINRNIILADLSHYARELKKGGVLLLSGFYKKDIPLIENALQRNGMKIEKETTEQDDWASLKAIKIS